MTARAPGVVVDITGDSPRNFAPPTNTGTMFMAGVAVAGRADAAVLCHTITDVRNFIDGKDPRSPLYDTAASALRKGVTDLWMGRLIGSGATYASHAFPDASAGASITVKAKGPGASTPKPQIVEGYIGDSVVIQVTDGDGLVLEESPSSLTVDELVQWGSTVAQLVSIVKTGNNLPDLAGATALTGGNDAASSITDGGVSQLATLFPKRLGPGQVCIPGANSLAAWVGLLNHAEANNRYALLDGVRSPDEADHVANIGDIQLDADLALLGETYGFYCGDWRVVPGPARGTTLTIPPCGIIGGLMAAEDSRSGGNPNSPAAGKRGIDNYSLGRELPEWTDAQRALLNEAGVNVFRNVYGEERLYGYRTLALPNDELSRAWTSAGGARLRMDLKNRLEILGEEYVLQEIDGQGHLIAAFNSAISALLQRYWTMGALYGATAPDSFVVDTGPTVNTPETLENRELHARVGIRISPFAEMVFIDVTSVALTEAL